MSRPRDRRMPPAMRPTSRTRAERGGRARRCRRSEWTRDDADDGSEWLCLRSPREYAMFVLGWRFPAPRRTFPLVVFSSMRGPLPVPRRPERRWRSFVAVSDLQALAHYHATVHRRRLHGRVQVRWQPDQRVAVHRRDPHVVGDGCQLQDHGAIDRLGRRIRLTPCGPDAAVGRS